MRSREGSLESTVFLRTEKGKSAEIAAILEQRIRSGDYKPGYRFPSERELAEQFGVSRNTVRDAKKTLERRNLIATKWGSGSLVLAESETARTMAEELLRSQHEWINVSQLRDLVEPNIAQLAAISATDADIITIGDLINRSNAHMNPDESLSLDMMFHISIARSTGNPLIEALLGFVNDATKKARLQTHETYAKRQLSIKGHERIFDYIRSRDAEKAGQAMRRHLQEIASVG